MRKRILSLSAAVICMAASAVYGQSPAKQNNLAKAEREVAKATNTTQLKKLSRDFSIAQHANKQMALELAKEKNWTVRHINKNGQVISLEGVDELGFPIYYITDNNTRAAASVRADQLWAGGATGLNLSGSNPALSGKLGVWDGGLILGTHQELAGRTVNRDQATSVSGHATHVAGTMIGSGVNPLAKGMSFGAPNLQGWDFSNDVAEMTAAASELLISNHSYGTISGWYFNDSRAGTSTNPSWEWRGNPNVSTTQDLNFGYYNATAQSFDKIAYEAPYYLIVKSSGNNRSQTGPAEGQPCWFPNSSGTLTVMNRPAGVSSNNSYDIIATYGTAKNILTVGAVEPIPAGYQKKQDVVISSFSSWGPTDDGRIKPDVVGNGVAVLSAYNTANNSYASLQGTSMAAPNVSGTLNLLQEHYYNTNGGFMRAATLKGLAIHTADEAGNTGPDYIYGWGLLNAERAANHISNTNGSNLLEERTLAEGQTYTFNVTASGKGPLVVTISWTDVEGAVLTANTAALNNRAPRLVNDLDVRISKNLATYMPWVLNPESPSSPAGLGDNFRDNVEQVYIANAVPGEVYTVTINHKGTLTKGPQAYSLLVSGIGGSPYCASGATTDADAKINNFTFGGIDNTPAAGCATYRDFTNLVAAVEPNQTLPLSVTLGTCGDENPRAAKVFVDWNADSDFDDAGELVATSQVVSTTSTYTTNITVPSTAVVNTQTRIRVVLAETSNANEITACGNYLKGETQDYLVRFNPRSKDVGVAALMYPDQSTCSNPSQGVAVKLRNFGNEAQSNIPLTVTVTEGGNAVATLTGTFEGPLSSYAEVTYFVPGTFNAEAGKTYTITSYTSLADDQQPENNQFVATRAVSDVNQTPTAEANKCGAGPVALRGTGNGTIFWYDALTGGNLIAAGNNTNVSTVPTGDVVYAALNEFAGTVPSPSNSSSGSYSSFTNGRMYFDANVPFVLEKATINVSNDGTGLRTMTIEVYDKDFSSDVIASTQILVTPGTKEYILNLDIPAAGKNYSYMVTNFGGGATAFRNSGTNSSAYPFKIDNVVSFTGNNQTTPSNFYYFLYDIKVKAAGCAGPRVAVPVNQAAELTAAITAAGNTTFCTGSSVELTANTGSNLLYLWYRNGAPIANATAASYTATTSGNYTVQVTNELGCVVTSAATTVTVNPLPPASILISQDLNLASCLGQPFSQVLRANTSTTHSSYTYQWFKNDSPIQDATTATYTATSSGTYTVKLSSSCGTITSAPLVINNETAQIAAAGAEICSGNNATISAQTNAGKLFWFDAETGGKLLKAGSSYTTPALTENKTYYVAASNETSGKLGSPSYVTGASASSFNGGRTYFNAVVPFVLEKVTINVATAGTMTIIVTDKELSNTVIASTTINVTPGVGQYDLNLYIPAAGDNYGIQVSAFGGGASAFRNNTTNSAAYPYALPGVASITGNNQTAPTSFYYFLYEWQVSTMSCQTAARTAVNVIVNETPAKPTVTQNGNTLTSSAATGNQWFFNGTAIPGANAQTLVAAESGAYSVKATSTSTCESPISDALNVTVTAIVKESDALNGVQVYPNPTNGKFVVRFAVTKPGNVKVVLLNSVGQTVYENTKSKTAGNHEQQIALNNLPTGVYILQIHADGNIYNRRVVVKQ